MCWGAACRMQVKTSPAMRGHAPSRLCVWVAWFSPARSRIAFSPMRCATLAWRSRSRWVAGTVRPGRKVHLGGPVERARLSKCIFWIGRALASFLSQVFDVHPEVPKHPNTALSEARFRDKYCGVGPTQGCRQQVTVVVWPPALSRGNVVVGT